MMDGVLHSEGAVLDLAEDEAAEMLESGVVEAVKAPKKAPAKKKSPAKKKAE